MTLNPVDDHWEAERQTHESVMMPGEIDHKSLGRAVKYKNKSCSVPEPQVHVGNQSCEYDVETLAVRRRRAHDGWNMALRWDCS